MAAHWFQYSATLANYNATVPQLIISGLNKDSLYTIKISSSNITGVNTDPTRYTVTGAVVVGFQDVNTRNNTANGAVFNNVAPDATGKIKVYVNTVAGSGDEAADISGLQIIMNHSVTLVPLVAITSPANNDTLSEDNSIVINATASESGGTISKVEFFVDTTKIGEDLSTPYSFTWTNPALGQHTLKVKATDALGSAATATTTVNIEASSSSWSTTGNIGTNPAGNFIGNVDSVRLAFRTKNIERMSLSPTGTLRLLNYKNNLAADSVLTTDTSGLLKFKLLSSSGHWLTSGATTYDSLDNIGIGTSNTHGYKLAVNGQAIFTKVVAMAYAKWPDYVFKKDYALPSLDSVATYIRIHGHLPELPSAAVVEKKGIDLGGNQTILLKKIEEMTLYLIEQNKELEALKQQNKKLEEQNRVLQTQQERIDRLEKLIDEAKSRH